MLECLGKRNFEFLACYILLDFFVAHYDAWLIVG